MAKNISLKTLPQKKHRILVMAHAHPDFSLGGGEIAAYNLFKAYRENTKVEDAWFLARADRRRGLTGAISLRRPNEYLWEQGVLDWHMMKAAHQESLTTWFADLIRALKPTVVHTHHYVHLGLEYLRVIKQVDPSIKIVMTLHEYMAICRNNGQMIKTGSFKLCSRESYDECHQCFPDKTAEDFWLRKHYFLSHFALVDQFVSPSEFLRQRYIAWGLKPEKVVVIENGQADEPILPPRPLAEGDTRNRFGFFGQINPYKGLDVALEALAQLPKKERKKITLEVHGANLEQQQPEYQEKIERLREPLIKQGVVQWLGPYQPHELRQRMAGIDWVVIPSIWWENSPMVIQEAFVCGRPLIVSDIGGMREKVNNNVDGLHVAAGNIRAWQQTLHATASVVDTWIQIVAGIKRPLTYDDCAKAHLTLLQCGVLGLKG
ncbi:glycosyltransferase family 4 protein [Nitrosomonas ureae]|uniref:Glycosyltransferase involved in cell wall bisynthesis n=1 Tax=Nitrosomonas ureae TaxID=44577 RepID=A0A1H5UHX3_9PROT|nr:glycosyltransferase family 4 protein [Nitrosomonas ureae]SEF74609.1 Glycosyltransferase involved in cell wall bisynthesis [Nitrosomonas ureae]